MTAKYEWTVEEFVDHDGDDEVISSKAYVSFKDAFTAKVTSKNEHRVVLVLTIDNKRYVARVDNDIRHFEDDYFSDEDGTDCGIIPSRFFNEIDTFNRV